MNYYVKAALIASVISCALQPTYSMEQQKNEPVTEEKNPVTNEQLLVLIQAMSTRLGDFTTDTAKNLQSLMAKIQVVETKMKELQEAQNKSVPAPSYPIPPYINNQSPYLGLTRATPPAHSLGASLQQGYTLQAGNLGAQPLRPGQSSSMLPAQSSAAIPAVPYAGTQQITATPAPYGAPGVLPPAQPAQSTRETQERTLIEGLLNRLSTLKPAECLAVGQKCQLYLQTHDGKVAYDHELFLRRAIVAFFKQAANQDTDLETKKKACLLYAPKVPKVDEKMKIYQNVLTLDCTNEEKATALSELVKIYSRRPACAKQLLEACLALVSNENNLSAAQALGNYHLGRIYEIGISVFPDLEKARAYYTAVLPAKGNGSAELRAKARKALDRLSGAQLPANPAKSEPSNDEEGLEAK